MALLQQFTLPAIGKKGSWDMNEQEIREAAMWKPETGLEELRKTRPEVAEYIEFREEAFDDVRATLEEFQRYDGSEDLWALLIRERDELRNQLAELTSREQQAEELATRISDACADEIHEVDMHFGTYVYGLALDILKDSREQQSAGTKQKAFDMSEAPRDGSTIIGIDADGEETLVMWSESRVCMLGPRAGSCGEGWATAFDGDTDSNLPMDDPVAWRPVGSEQRSADDATLINLQPLRDNPEFADRVVTHKRSDGTVYEFRDSTRLHSSYQVGNPASHPPDGTIAAAMIHGRWHWVIRTSN